MLEKPLLQEPVIKPISDKSHLHNVCPGDLIANPFETDSEEEYTMQSFQPLHDLQCHLPGPNYDLESHTQITKTGLSDLTGMLQQQITKNPFSADTSFHTPSPAKIEATETYLNSNISRQSFDQFPELNLPQLRRVSWHKPSNSLPDALPSSITSATAPFSTEHPVSLSADLPHPRQPQLHIFQNTLPLNQNITEGTSYIQMSLNCSNNLPVLHKTPPKRPLTSPPPLFPQHQARQLHQTAEGSVVFNKNSTVRTSSIPVSANRLSIDSGPKFLNNQAQPEPQLSKFDTRKSILSGELQLPHVKFDRKSIFMDHGDSFSEKTSANHNARKKSKITGLIDNPEPTKEPIWRSPQQQPDFQKSLHEIPSYSHPVNYTLHTQNIKHLSFSSLSTCDSATSDSTSCLFQLSSSPLQTSPSSVNSTTNVTISNNRSSLGNQKRLSTSSAQHLGSKYCQPIFFDKSKKNSEKNKIFFDFTIIIYHILFLLYKTSI